MLTDCYHQVHHRRHPTWMVEQAERVRRDGCKSSTPVGARAVPPAGHGQVGRPDEKFGLAVVMVQVFLDGHLQFAHAGEDSSAEALLTTVPVVPTSCFAVCRKPPDYNAICNSQC